VGRYKTNAKSGGYEWICGKFSGASSVTIAIWDPDASLTSTVSLSSNSCSQLTDGGGSGIWVWSTQNFTSQPTTKKTYIYQMTADTGDKWEGKFTFGGWADDIDEILDDTGTTLPGQISALNDPSASDIADAVWDEAAADHAAAGSFGEKNQKIIPSETIDDYKADVSGLATAASLSSHDAKLNVVDANVDAILQDTSTTLDDKLDTIDTVVDAIRANTDKMVFDGANNLYTAPQTSVTVSNVDDCKADVSALATTSQLNTVESNIRGADLDTLKTLSDQMDAILEDTGTTLDGKLNAIQADLDNPDQYKADVSSLATSSELSTLESNIRGADGDTLKTLSDQIDSTTMVSAESVADAVWDESSAGHTGALKDISDNIASVLEDTSTTIPSQMTSDKDSIIAEVNGVADEVLDESLDGHSTEGTLGAEIKQIKNLTVAGL